MKKIRWFARGNGEQTKLLMGDIAPQLMDLMNFIPELHVYDDGWTVLWLGAFLNYYNKANTDSMYRFMLVTQGLKSCYMFWPNRNVVK